MAEVVSFSDLADFWCCPRLYHYRQELKLPPPMHQGEARREGSWIHQQLDIHAQGLTPQIATDTAWQALWKAYLETISPYADWHCLSEWGCHLPLRIDGEEIWLHGRMDRIYHQGDKLVLLDFKTGENGVHEPDPSQTFQLEVYAWLLWQVQDLLPPDRPLQQIQARAIWLKTGERVEHILTNDSVPDIGARVQALLEGLLSPGSHDVPAPRSVAGRPWCTICAYRQICPEGQQAGMPMLSPGSHSD